MPWACPTWPARSVEGIPHFTELQQAVHELRDPFAELRMEVTQLKETSTYAGNHLPTQQLLHPGSNASNVSVLMLEVLLIIYGAWNMLWHERVGGKLLVKGIVWAKLHHSLHHSLDLIQ